MYLNETEKLYNIVLEDGEIFDGGKFVKDLIYWERVAYTKERANALMLEIYRGLPYKLVHNGNQVVIAEMDGWCGIKGKQQAWHKLEVDLAFAPGYSIRGIGTEEIVLQVSTESVHNYYDIHIRGNKITEVYQTFFGERKRTTLVCFEIDNPVARFFRVTDVKADLTKLTSPGAAK